MLKSRLEKSHRLRGHQPFDRIALLPQGGGAVGAYQAGGHEVLKGGAARSLVAATVEIALWMVFAAFAWIAVNAILSCLAG